MNTEHGAHDENEDGLTLATEVSDEAEVWLAGITSDADASDEGPATAGNRIECREGCGW